jgi:hypothetical protein
MLSDWCKGIGYSNMCKEFGIAVLGEDDLALFSLGFDGFMPSCVIGEFRTLNFTKTGRLIMPINLCKWETEE